MILLHKHTNTIGLSIGYAAPDGITKRLIEVVNPMLLPREVEEMGVATVATVATEEEDEKGNEIEVEANSIEDFRQIDANIQKCLLSVLNIGIRCSMESPKERMSMEEVIKELQLIKKKYTFDGSRIPQGRSSQAQITGVVLMYYASGFLLEATTSLESFRFQCLMPLSSYCLMSPKMNLLELGKLMSNELNFLNSLTNCSSLQVLGLDDNDFGAVLPNSIANLSSQLRTLTLSDQVSGQVSYGSVFKGILDGDGKEVAVKVLNLQNQGASKSFMAECKALRNILTPESSEDHNFVLNNVLLDNDMTGDFGSARLIAKTTTSRSWNQSGIKGAIGYVAPEYGMGSEVSTYGDVYSYGILLSEMFTGKRPTDEIFKNSLSLHEFVKTALA
uniref:Protein kinase domain-containing protein n=1 Tax=Fagus sylvatica TaxID=28930 RepID=A0A2N9HYB4_FAGSY